MKKKSTSQSAFFNLRVLTGLCIVFVGVFLALAGFGAKSQKNTIITSSRDPLVPVPFDCSKIHELGIDKQENMRAGAIMIACGQAQGGTSSIGGMVSQAIEALPLPRAIKKLLRPVPSIYGATDVDLITGTETSPNITQSETFTIANPDNPNQVFAAYNDSRGRNITPINISGASWSTDGGVTFTRLTDPARGNQSPFPGTEGDPVALYNRPTQTWFTVWLDTACGGQGLGGFKSTTPGDPSAASWTHFCVYNEGSADRESGWADNNPSSPFYGRMYVSWNDFAVGGGALGVRYSTDNGLTWTNFRTLNPGFVRDVQITGDYATGVVYVASMNENGGGFPHNDNNLFYRSTDGGNTWTNTYTGPAFPGPGNSTCSSNAYFATMFAGYWRHEGWGEPAALNGVVSYVYAGGAGADNGNIYYIRSTDMGVTFSAPLQLNTDSTTRPQWQPNLSVSPSGTLLATWYDARETTTCTVGATGVPCYRMWGRKSNDNGATWQPDMAVSDVVTPLPAQPDGGIVSCYVGDYDYASATAAKHLTSWADGRVAIGGQSQQDAFTDRELVGFAVISTVPACNSVINTQPNDFVINLSDAVNSGTVQATDFTVNGTPANSFVISGDMKMITFHFNSSPVVTQGVQTMHIPANAFTRVSDGMGVFDFSCTFCYAVTPLQVTSTNPAVGGTFNPPAPGDYSYDVIFNQNIDAASVSTSDLTLTMGSVTAVTVSGNTAHFTLHFNFGGPVTASIGAGAVTANGCNGNAAFSGDYTVSGCPPSDHYTISQITASIVPGTVDTGNHVDDGTTPITLPFPYTLYDQTFTTANVDSNGTLQFGTPSSVFTNTCLPFVAHPYTILPYWDDLYNVNAGFGIFTSISGTAPNRIFNIEHRSQYFPGSGTANFEIRLYEGQTRFDVIYGTLTNGNTSATAGVQKSDTIFDQYFCNGTGNPATGAQSYILTPCNQVTVSSAVSRKIHGGAGTFDIALPLTGTDGVECRSTGGTNDYTMVVTFSGNVTVTGSPQAQVTAGAGCVGSGGGCTGNVTVSGNVVTVPLTNITDQQNINVRINGVNGAADAPATDINIPMGVLIGDTNANRAVNASDVSQTKGQSGNPVTAANFRTDVNANGSINAGDINIVKANSGHSVP